MWIRAIIIFVAFVAYMWIGLFISTLTTEQDESPPIWLVIIWPIFLMAIAGLGFFYLPIKLARLINKRKQKEK